MLCSLLLRYPSLPSPSSPLSLPPQVQGGAFALSVAPGLVACACAGGVVRLFQVRINCARGVVRLFKLRISCAGGGCTPLPGKDKLPGDAFPDSLKHPLW